MFKKLLASAGIGSAKIDLILNQESLTMGEPVIGQIVLKGGKVEQEIESLYVDFRLASSFKKDGEFIDIDETVAVIQVNQRTLIKEGETREFPFQFICPKCLPVSRIHTRFYFQSNLEIKYGLDSFDRDYVAVHPIGLQKNFLGAFEALGFRLHNEGYTGAKFGTIQILKFYPEMWLHDQLDEIIFMYQITNINEEVSGLFKFHKKARNLDGSVEGYANTGEKKGNFCFRFNELATIEQATQTVQQFILDHIGCL
ncbi:sporulation-control protein [Thermoflavimicrobium dichotomicum]|uniref:Sporulation-control protein n=2 Tax=Thermoflavimicrobium dichotomicum TaxID=46223 RepID=A0A1I3JJI7_9BACL|nr:sporulation-control protein [Thermoflavimicrobium dichotomicum]